MLQSLFQRQVRSMINGTILHIINSTKNSRYVWISIGLAILHIFFYMQFSAVLFRSLDGKGYARMITRIKNIVVAHQLLTFDRKEKLQELN